MVSYTYEFGVLFGIILAFAGLIGVVLGAVNDLSDDAS